MFKRYCLYGLISGLIMAWPNVYATELADPTRPANYDPVAAQAEMAKGLALTGIFLSVKERTAVINGQLLHVGDRIDGFQVLTITGDSVRLKGAKGVFTILLAQIEVKQPAYTGQKKE